MGKYTRRGMCRLCSSKELELAFQLAPTPIGDAYLPVKQKLESYPVELFLCRSCGLAQLLDVVEPEEVYRPYIYRTADSLGLVEHFRKYADEVMKAVNPKKGGLVVDIGGNDGSFLKFFRNHGMKVLGVDPATKIAREATESGIKTLPAFFTPELASEIRKENGNASIITANNTMANIDDLQGMMDGVKKLLAPDGVFVFETGYVLDLLQKKIIDNIYHEHISYFSVKPLENFFRNNSLELIDAKRVATKGGSLRCTVQLKGGPRKRSPAADELIKLEAESRIHNHETFRAFASELENIKNELTKLLNGLKAKGKLIAGYGASVGVTTILHNFGLNKNLISFLVDDNPNRQNLYSPGLNIPVLNPKALYEKKPDYVVILAWQYAKPILDKNKAYLKHGRFINIIPKVEVA